MGARAVQTAIAALACAALAVTAGCRGRPAAGEAPDAEAARGARPDGGEAAPADAGEAPGPTPADGPDVAAAAPAEDAPGALADPAVAPVLARRAVDALSCDWRDGFSVACTPYRAWLDALGGPGDDRGLAALLGDGDPRVRYLGAAGLLRRGDAYRRAADLAAAVVAAAEAERDAAVAGPLGAAVARLDLGATGLGARVRAVAERHPLAAMRAAVLGDLLVYGGDAWFDLTAARAADDPDPAVRVAALSAFWAGGSGRAEEVCALWQAHADVPEARVAEKAAYLLAFWQRCRDRYDGLLDVLARRAAAGRMTWAYFASLEALASDRGATDAQRARAVAVARQVAEARANPWEARNRALDWLVAHDDDARAFLEGFPPEEEVLVQDKLEALRREVGLPAP